MNNECSMKGNCNRLRQLHLSFHYKSRDNTREMINDKMKRLSELPCCIPLLCTWWTHNKHMSNFYRWRKVLVWNVLLLLWLVFTAWRTIVQSAVLRWHVVCLSVTLVDHDHIGWKSWKITARTISPTSLLFLAQRSSTYSQGNMEKFWGKNVRSAPTSITSVWIESSSTESHVILGGGEAAGCLFTFVVASRGNLCDCTAFLSVLCILFLVAVSLLSSSAQKHLPRATCLRI